MTTSIKNNIKNIRELKNYTQQYMADQLSITQAGYSKIEIGTTSISYSKLMQISTVLKVSVEDIINFDHQKYITNLNTVDDNDNNAACNNNCKLFKGLYEDKIKLLEKLLSKVELELEYYKK